MRINRRTFTIPAGSSLSEVQKLNDSEIVMAVEMPASWTTANVTFLAGTTPALIQSYYRQGIELSLAVSAASFQELDALGYFTSARYLQLRSGTSAIPVNQASTRTLIIITIEL